MRAVVLGVLVLAGVASAGCASSGPGASAPAPRVLRAFVTQDSGQAAGESVIAAGKAGVVVRPAPGGRFGLLVVLRNRTHRQLTIEDVRAVVPQGSVVRQLGTHLAPFFRCHPYCPRHQVLHGPFGAGRPAPVWVRPTRAAQAELTFGFGDCSSLRNASVAPVTRAVVVYRTRRGGRKFRQTLALRSSQLSVRRTGTSTCRE
jgi:hypothetical protein